MKRRCIDCNVSTQRECAICYAGLCDGCAKKHECFKAALAAYTKAALAAYTARKKP